MAREPARHVTDGVEPVGASPVDGTGRRDRLRLLREPMLHFLLVGAMLFAVHAWLDRGGDDLPGTAARTVRIGTAQVEWLRQTWTRQWQRPPSQEELRALIAGYLEEELLAREARALGLDENDTIVRRRLAQKMEFLVTDASEQSEPSEAQLRRLYETERAHFQSPARVTFRHVYFNTDRRGDRALPDARAALRQLSGADTGSAFGDRFLGPYEFVDADEQAVASVLGPEFAREVLATAPGTWQGPLTSGYGLHLVLVEARRSEQSREFAAARDEVLKLWRERRASDERKAYFATLLDKYDVLVDESVQRLVGPLALAKEVGR